MSAVADHYDVYYADKLWNLLPAVYRSEDTDRYDAHGSLRELVNRVGRQVAIVRRDLDRLWDNQSIETCDDWLIAYLGDLVATRLVSSLDARGQRIDVAKTIYYRRRKGTVALLEELAHDITGWDARVCEFFRRMGRTRHGLDPAIGLPVEPGDDTDRLQRAEGLRGAMSRTGIGGFADLRNVQGALLNGSAFDEYFHTADVRAPSGRAGWYDIARIGVFLWRLHSFPAGPVTPVPVLGCPGWFTFDPTGRDIPLFAVSRSLTTCDAWSSPDIAQVAAPISQTTFDASVSPADQPDALYPEPISVLSPLPPPGEIVPLGQILIRPPRGRFKVEHAVSPDPYPPPYQATYHYGFSSAIGAGPADRRIDALTVAAPAPLYSVAGGGALSAAKVFTTGTGTVTIGDSLTYDDLPDLPAVGPLTIQAENQQRPLLRIASDWTITGAGGQLALDGLFVSGADLVLAGSFDTVTISCSTLDPGTARDGGDTGILSPPVAAAAPFANAADGRPLVPTRLWVEGTVRTLTIDRSILAAVRTRAAGLIENLAISNSILQAIPSASGPLDAAQIKDPWRLLRLIRAADDPVSQRLRVLSPTLDTLLGPRVSPPPPVGAPPAGLDVDALAAALDALLASQPLYDATAFARVRLSAAAVRLLGQQASSAAVASPDPVLFALNRQLLDDAWPLEIADACIALADGKLALTRTTVMGRLVAHELSASESILQDLAVVDDLQQGCVRFSAWADGSALPRQYESVRIAQLADLFTSERFGDPGYAQLRAGVDNAILSAPAGTGAGASGTIAAGAANGAEMGAFAREANPLKENALRIKFQEFMPAGLLPVLVYVT